MSLQPLKSFNRWTIALIVAACAITGAKLYYNILRFGHKSAKPVASAPVNQPITALGRVEPVSEVVRVSAPTMLNNDRIARCDVCCIGSDRDA